MAANGVERVFLGLVAVSEMVDEYQRAICFGRDAVKFIEKERLIAAVIFVSFDVQYT